MFRYRPIHIGISWDPKVVESFMVSAKVKNPTNHFHGNPPRFKRLPALAPGSKGTLLEAAQRRGIGIEQEV
jgi:hypothetical protein